MREVNFADLDELILQCHSKNAKRYIDEAVRCYKGGAFKATIIMTWIGVMYDFIDKLKELELTGDKNASKKVEQFENYCKEEDIGNLLKFERGLLGLMKDDFEFISATEYAELKRLQEDRNRFAHSSLGIEGEESDASPELARLHLRNAVEHVLCHPPVQGKVALSFLTKEVESDHFPNTSVKAKEVFKRGPLARPRKVLVRNFLIALSKSLLNDKFERLLSLEQRIAAIEAVIDLQPEYSREVLFEKFNQIAILIPDDRYLRCIFVLSKVGALVEFLQEDMKIKLSQCVLNSATNNAVYIVISALDVSFLREDALKRIDSITVDDIFESSFENLPVIPKEIIDRSLYLYKQSMNYDVANKVGVILSVVTHCLSEMQVVSVFEATKNPQVSESVNLHKVLGAIKTSEIVEPKRFNELMESYGLSESHAGLLYQLDEKPEDEEMPDIPF